MLCKKCGAEFEGNFCSNCGASVGATGSGEKKVPIPRLKEPYYVDFGGQLLDANSIIRMYGFGIRKRGAYVYISQKTGLPIPVVKGQLDPLIQHHMDAGESTNIFDGAKAQIKMDLSGAQKGQTAQAKEKPLSKRQRIKENKRSGVACCPKCGSTSLSASKQGFGGGKAVMGTIAVGLPGALAGSINANKTRVTCLNCGHKWKM